MATEDFERHMRNAAKLGVPGTWLIIFPASGTVWRRTGRLAAVDMGSGLTPFIFADDDRPVALDARGLILNDETLAVAWQPREHIGRIHGGLAKWFEDNPDVFRPTTKSGFTAFYST